MVKKKIFPIENIVPVFNSLPVTEKSAMFSSVEVSPKKAIRRSALEIKEAEELEENKKTKQEEEWEIPAFLRFKK